MAFVIDHTVSDGLKGGAASAFGIALADIIMTLLTASGVAATIAAWPFSFDTLRYAGATYLVWLAFKTLGRRRDSAVVAHKPLSMHRVVMRGIVNNLLNPKALLFFVVFLPQFVMPGKGPVFQQLFVLGITLTLISFVFHTLLGTVWSSLHPVLQLYPKASRVQAISLAGLFLLLAWHLLTLTTAA